MNENDYATLRLAYGDPSVITVSDDAEAVRAAAEKAFPSMDDLQAFLPPLVFAHLSAVERERLLPTLDYEVEPVGLDDLAAMGVPGDQINATWRRLLELREATSAGGTAMAQFTDERWAAHRAWRDSRDTKKAVAAAVTAYEVNRQRLLDYRREAGLPTIDARGSDREATIREPHVVLADTVVQLAQLDHLNQDIGPAIEALGALGYDTEDLRRQVDNVATQLAGVDQPRRRDGHPGMR